MNAELNKTMGEVEVLKSQVKILREACQKFVDKVDSGRAQSRDSYAVFKQALELTKPTT